MVIAEHMKIVGNDGLPVGTVDRLEGERIKLTRAGHKAGQRTTTTTSIADWLIASKAIRFT